MIFKKIEMVGFKSFADRTVIEFDNNLTAIVGPNGCGKSNVSDAIRWVLGEQSAKSLRGDSMQDVIFSGTEKRRSLSYCEVTLTFDNTTRFFNFDYDEIAITRKLYRSGESEYLINRNTCHLRDIINLLYNSGLGKSGYSVIGQGKVTEIVDSKPENRRAMFEDAAGIAKYKKDKVDAERKLENTRDNLTRVGDILSEIERQLGPLKKQAENAKKYLEYKDKLKDLEINAYIYQYENANTIKDEISVKLDGITKQLSLRQEDLEKANEEYNQAMSDLNNFDKLLSSINDEILALTVALEKQEGETKIIRERINYTQRENDRLNLDKTNANVALDAIYERTDAKTKELSASESALEALEKSFNELSEKYLAIANELALSENEEGQSQQKIIEALGSLSDVRTSATRLSTERELLSTNFENLTKDISALSLKLDENKAEFAKVQKEIEDLEKSLGQIKSRSDSLASSHFLEERKARDLENEKANITTQIKVFENRRKLLSDLQAEYEGYSYAVRKLLKESERSSALKKNIVGVVASLIKVPQKFETAIEVALGGAVQNIVTFDEDGAKELISFLKNNSFGRATFLPISSMKRRDLDERLVSGKKGCFGIASHLVEFDKSIDNVVSNLLGSTVICDTLYTAVELAKESHYAYRIVTLDGDVVNPQGSLTGGSKKSESASLVGRAREIETLGSEIERLNKRLGEIDREHESIMKNFTSAKTELESLSSQKAQLEIELAKARERELGLKNTVDELSDNLKVSEMESTTVKNKLALIDGELARAKKMENALSGNQTDAADLAKEKKTRNESLRAEREKINDNLSSVKVEIASTKAKIEAAREELGRLQDEKSKQERNIVNIDYEIGKNNEYIETAEQTIKDKLAKSPQSAQKDKLNDAMNRRNQIDESKKELGEKISKLDGDKAWIMEEISKINDKKYKQEMNLAKVDTELERMQENIFEEYSLVYTDCLEFRRPDFDIDVAMPEISKLKKDIAALGYVNVNAIEDSKVLLGRYDELAAQSDDLKKAEEDLTKIIKDLSQIMIEKFNNELDRINESFKITFRELFGGGTAKLALSDETNPLESGVEIFAQPPGKKIQNMTLLSGGEKSLTAMAVIFAILRIKPLPFCLFDEVEAALDDSNVEIVDKYLKKLSNETQFILITHKKPTMEYAEALYGVTMEEKGVSKIVSVKLSDAIKHAQEG